MGFKWGQELLKAKEIIRYLEECYNELKKDNIFLNFACIDLIQENKALKQEIEELKTKLVDETQTQK